MASQVPIVRQTSWGAVIPQLLILAGAAWIGSRIWPTNGMFIGVFAFLVYSLGSRQIIASHHRSGVILVKQEQYAEAIPEFEKSLAFFDKYPWIDKARSIILMSASRSSYREMALANIGFCHSQLGHGDEAREAYTHCLERFPDSGLAKAALRLLNSTQQT